MDEFEHTIIDNFTKNQHKPEYFLNFKSYFPATNIPSPLPPSSQPSLLQNTFSGGQPPRYNYPRQYPNIQKSSYPPINEPTNNKSKLAYYITVDMELYPGTTIPPEEINNLKCNQKWNAVRKAYAEFIGKPYTIPPVYREEKTKNNNTRKPIVPNNNKTVRKY